MACRFGDELNDTNRAISLSLQILGNRGVARVLPELFTVWKTHRTFIAEELVSLEFTECFDALNAFNLLNISEMVSRVTKKELSPEVVPWMTDTYPDWFKANRAKRDALYATLISLGRFEELLALIRVGGVSSSLLAKGTKQHFNDSIDRVEAVAEAAKYVDTD